ncbi:hypothetical protein [Photobacterium ganghwense]|uniref:hypothetical protein n=1 Tax=Photobacterium ganghwense TaxID=320778 RepID=UPI0039EDF426
MSKRRLSFLFFSASVVSTLLFWMGAYFWFDASVSFVVENAKAILLEKPDSILSNQDAQNLGRLIEKGIVIEGNDVIDRVADFYTTIITLLITIITILGITIPLYIKTNAENVARQQTKTEVKTYFNENVQYRDEIEKVYKKYEPEIKRHLDSEIDGWSSTYEERFEFIERRLPKSDVDLDREFELDSKKISDLEMKYLMIEKYVQQLDPEEKQAAQGSVGDL